MEIDRGSKIICPFHGDNNPSMKVDQRFHCFGCGEDGDVIDFVSKYFEISNVDAAKKIAAEFGISIDDDSAYSAAEYCKRPKVNYRQLKSETMLFLIRLEKELKAWIRDYAPKNENENPHFLFVDAIQNIDYVSYLIDTLIECNTDEEIKEFIKNNKGEFTV